MPKLWNATIETHRRDVREAILHAAGRLAGGEGLRAVTMSRVAQEAGIGRATLYKYYPDAEAILVDWHRGHAARHVAHLSALGGGPGGPWARLEAMARAYAASAHHRAREEPALAALVHRGEGMDDARRQLTGLFADRLAEAAAEGRARGDVPAGELAAYCVRALEAAGDLSSAAAVRRLVAVTLDALRAR